MLYVFNNICSRCLKQLGHLLLSKPYSLIFKENLYTCLPILRLIVNVKPLTQAAF